MVSTFFCSPSVGAFSDSRENNNALPECNHRVPVAS